MIRPKRPGLVLAIVGVCLLIAGALAGLSYAGFFNDAPVLQNACSAFPDVYHTHTVKGTPITLQRQPALSRYFCYWEGDQYTVGVLINDYKPVIQSDFNANMGDPQWLNNAKNDIGPADTGHRFIASKAFSYTQPGGAGVEYLTTYRPSGQQYPITVQVVWYDDYVVKPTPLALQKLGADSSAAF